MKIGNTSERALNFIVKVLINKGLAYHAINQDHLSRQDFLEIVSILEGMGWYVTHDMLFNCYRMWILPNESMKNNDYTQ